MLFYIKHIVPSLYFIYFEDGEHITIMIYLSNFSKKKTIHYKPYFFCKYPSSNTVGYIFIFYRMHPACARVKNSRCV
jgi:hypothetical protein